MRFCESHWSALRSAIDERGLTPYVASGGAEVMKRMQATADGQQFAGFEPLMAAHMDIIGRLMEIGGLSLMQPNDDGSERCPMCFANGQHALGCKVPDCKYSYDIWIGFAADAQLGEARRLGLVPTQ